MSSQPNIVALGAGRMGRGIAQVFAYAGHEVTVLDFKERSPDDSQKLLAEGKAEIKENLEFLVCSRRQESPNNLRSYPRCTHQRCAGPLRKSRLHLRRCA